MLKSQQFLQKSVAFFNVKNYFQFFTRSVTSLQQHRVKKLCGSKKPNPLFSSGNKILIRFHSDGDEHERVGFKLRVEEKGDECLLPYCQFKMDFHS